MATVKIGLEVDPTTGKAKLVDFSKELDKTDDSAKKLSKSAKDLTKDLGEDMASKLGPAGKALAAMGPAGLAAAAGLGVMAAAYTALVKVTIESVSHLVEVGSNFNDLAARSGVGVEALQEFGFAAKMTGASTEDFVGALRVMQVNLVENEEKFRKLGLSVAELRQLSPEDQFMRVAEAIRDIKDPMEQAAAAQAVFGRGASTILPAIKQGMEGLRDQARDLGVVLGEDVVNAADALGDEATKLGEAWEAVKNQLAAVIVQNPDLVGGLKDVAEAVGGIAAVIRDNKSSFDFLFQMLGGAALSGVRGLAQRGKEAAEDLQVMFGTVDMPRPKTPTGFGMAAPDPFGAIGGAAAVEAAKSAQLAADLAKARSAAAAAEAKAKSDIQAMAGVIKASGKQLDDFWKQQEKLASEYGKKVLEHLLDTQKAIGPVIVASGKQVEDFLAEQEKLAGEKGKQVLEDLLKRQAEAEQAFQNLIGSVHDLGGSFDFLGDVVGGTFGGILKLAGSVTHSIADIGQGIHSIQNAGGGLTGMLSKIGSGIGIAGAAFSIGKAIGGFLFGNKEEERKREEERRQATKKAITDLQALQERLERFRMDKINEAVGGTTAMFKNLAVQGDVTQERLDRVGRMGFASFQMLKAEGLSTGEAFERIGPMLDAAIEAAEKAGLELPAALAQLASFRAKVTDNPELVAAQDGLNGYITALIATGGMTQDVLSDVQAELHDLYDDMIAKGFTANEALTQSAEGLYALKQAAEAGRISLDDETQAMIDQAEQAGLFENLKDPMAELVEIQKLQLEVTMALAKVFGAVLPAEVQKYIDKLHQIPTVPGAPGGADTGESKIPYEGHVPVGDVPGMATGGYVPYSPPSGTLRRLGESEAEYVVPASRMTSTTADVGLTYAPTVNVSGAGGDPRQTAKAVTEALRQHDADLRAQLAQVVRQVVRERGA